MEEKDNNTSELTKNTAAVSAAAASNIVPDQTPEPVKTKQHPPASKGEKWFDWMVYSGLNYWVNLAMSIAITDYFTRLGGRQTLDKAIGATSRAVAGMGLKLETAQQHSRVAWETFMLTSGGNLLTVPLKYMEDNKRNIVYWLNEKLGEKQIAPDGHKMTPDEIYIEKEQPKQSWLNVFLRRGAGIVAVTGSGIALDHIAGDKTVPRTYSYTVDGVTHTKEGHLGGKERITNLAIGGLNQILPEKMVKSPAVQSYMNLAVLDLVFTKLTAAIMHMTNGAKKGHAPGEIDGEQPADKPATLAPVAIPPAAPIIAEAASVTPPVVAEPAAVVDEVPETKAMEGAHVAQLKAQSHHHAKEHHKEPHHKEHHKEHHKASSFVEMAQQSSDKQATNMLGT
ncbi:MAG: hypothetical protein SFT92_01000 [Rickettsiales bacterium]|nr:hypothetical protein [Rickettsiales bacterium]